MQILLILLLLNLIGMNKLQLYTILIIVGLSCASLNNAQDLHLVDSLESVVGLLEGSEEKVDLLIELGDEFRISDLYRSIG